MRGKREATIIYIDYYIPPPLPYGWGGAAPGGNPKLREYLFCCGVCCDVGRRPPARDIRRTPSGAGTGPLSINLTPPRLFLVPFSSLSPAEYPETLSS